MNELYFKSQYQKKHLSPEEVLQLLENIQDQYNDRWQELESKIDEQESYIIELENELYDLRDNNREQESCMMELEAKIEDLQDRLSKLDLSYDPQA